MRHEEAVAVVIGTARSGHEGKWSHSLFCYRHWPSSRQCCRRSLVLATDYIQFALHGFNRIVAQEQRKDTRQIDYFHELESKYIFLEDALLLILRALYVGGVDPV